MITICLLFITIFINIDLDDINLNLFNFIYKNRVYLSWILVKAINLILKVEILILNIFIINIKSRKKLKINLDVSNSLKEMKAQNDAFNINFRQEYVSTEHHSDWSDSEWSKWHKRLESKYSENEESPLSQERNSSNSDSLNQRSSLS